MQLTLPSYSLSPSDYLQVTVSNPIYGSNNLVWKLLLDRNTWKHNYDCCCSVSILSTYPLFGTIQPIIVLIVILPFIVLIDILPIIVDSYSTTYCSHHYSTNYCSQLFYHLLFSSLFYQLLFTVFLPLIVLIIILPIIVDSYSTTYCSHRYSTTYCSHSYYTVKQFDNSLSCIHFFFVFFTNWWFYKQNQFQSKILLSYGSADRSKQDCHQLPYKKNQATARDWRLTCFLPSRCFRVSFLSAQ